MTNSIDIRRSKYELTEEQKKAAIELAIEGHSIRKILDKILISSYHFYRFKQTNPEFENIFATARLEGLEHLADDLLDIADDQSIDVNRARLKSDNSKWVLSKRKPQIYGDRLNLEVNTTIDIGTALKEARSRVALPKTSEALENNEDILEIETIEDSVDIFK